MQKIVEETEEEIYSKNLETEEEQIETEKEVETEIDEVTDIITDLKEEETDIKIDTEVQTDSINEIIENNTTSEEIINNDVVIAEDSNKSKNEIVKSDETEMIEELQIKEEEVTETISYQEVIPELGENTDEKLDFVHENYGEAIENYAFISGIDQHLLECIYAQERGIHSESMDPLGTIGIAQILYNDHVNKQKTLYNILTGETETFIATEEVLKSLDGNIKTSISLLQYLLNYYDGNTLMALQAYNYGNGALDKVLKNAEDRTGISREDMIHDPSCLVWLEDVKTYQNGEYGDPNYIENVFSRYTETEFTAIYDTENPVIVNLDQNVLKKSR